MSEARRARLYLAPLISGTLLVFGYAPFSIPALPFVGLVPFLLFLDRPLTPRQVHIGGWAFAIPYFLGTVYWMFNLSRFTVAALPGTLGTLALHFATFFIFPIVVAVGRRRLGTPLVLLAPMAWVVSEHARTYGDFYFPWVTLGYALSDWPLLIQHADLIGVYGISWWLVLVNALIATLVLRSRRSAPLRGTLAALAALLLVPLAYDALRWRGVEAGLDDAPTVRVAVLQPNVAQQDKWSREAAPRIFDDLNRLIAEAEALGVDLVVGPEASLPLVLRDDATRLPAPIGAGRRPLLLGAITGIGELEEQQVGGATRRAYRDHYNSAWLADPGRSVIGRHDKQFLVPVTEQIPYPEVLGLLRVFMRAQFGGFVPARRLGLLALPDSDVHFGALICYESLFPRLVARMRRAGAQFFVNITNDAWFGRSSMPYQHAGFCVLRAIENRCSIVRSANTGISAFYDPLGRIRSRSTIFHRALMAGEVRLTSERTFYARAGNLLLYLSYGVVFVVLGLAWRSSGGRRGAARSG